MIVSKGTSVENGNVQDFLVEALRREEYRGYDSAGVALWSRANGITLIKTAGKVDTLEEKISTSRLNDDYIIGIAHTRWATHGEPSENNSHPHTNEDGSIAIVHNGIIENYRPIKKSLEEAGYKFKSETDSEVIPHLIDFYMRNHGQDFESAFKKTFSRLEGSYAILGMHKDYEMLIGARNGSPLIVGVNSNGTKDYTLGSDEAPFIDRTKRAYDLEDRNMIIINPNGHIIKTFDGFNINREIREIACDIRTIGKCGFEHYMLKEIHEQPETVSNAFRTRINNLNNLEGDNFPGIPKNIKRVLFLACGTSLHAGLVGEYIVEKYSRIPSRAESASEFRYRQPVLSTQDVVVPISQSGQTADTIGALKLAKEYGCYTLGIVNKPGSEIANLAGKGLYLHAGPEIGVASTKAFTSQIVAINILNLFLNKSDKYKIRVVEELKQLPGKVKQALETTESLTQKIAKEISGVHNILFLGRGVNYAVALEGALKLKEISYINAQGYGTGELKHGPIALVDENTPSIFINTGNDETFRKTLSSIKEVKARGGRIIAVTDKPNGLEDCLSPGDCVIEVPHTIEELSPVINAIPLQFLAYYIARERGCNIDKPRNLAKSVTVE